MSESDGLDLRSVVDRFDQSATTLDQLHGRIAALATAQVEQESHTRTMWSAASEIKAMTFELASATKAIGEAVGAAREALEAGTAFMASTDLSVVREGVEAMRTDASVTREHNTLIT